MSSVGGVVVASAVVASVVGGGVDVGAGGGIGMRVHKVGETKSPPEQVNPEFAFAHNSSQPPFPLSSHDSPA